MKRKSGDGLTTRYKEWLCFNCGYMCSAASSMLYDAVPGEGDISACINCGAVSILRDGKWVKPTEAEWAEVDREARRDIALHQLAIAEMHQTMGRPSDRKRRGGNA